jgi:hypothetical protein
MDLNKETNVEKLKAMAFDAIQAMEVQQQNLRALQQRIAQLQEEAPKAK